MLFDELIHAIEMSGANVYDLALYTDQEGIRSHRFQSCSNAQDSYSVAKAFVVTAIGMLWDENKLQLTNRFASLFADELPKDADLGWQVATVEHAITHRLGFDENFLDIDVDDVESIIDQDWLQLVFRHPLKHIPGTHNQYTDAAYYLLSRTISKIAGENLDSFLMRRLFRPMKFHEVAWSCCPMNYPIGASGLYVSSADMVKLGALYLNHGMWQGKRYLSEAWVRKCIGSEFEFHPIISHGELIGKGGMYGQVLLFSPVNRFALAWHAHESADHGKKLLYTLEQLLCVS